MVIDFSKCCEKGFNILWRKKDTYNGPDKDGWAIDMNNYSYPDSSFENIYYCPFCGTKLPERSDHDSLR